MATAATPTGNGFAGADASVDAQKKALLAAVAQQGTVGRAAYDTQVKEAEAARQAAVKAATDRAKLINAPTALVNQQTAESGAITDRYKADATAAQAAYDRESARSTQANGSYMDQVKAAIPLAQAVAAARRDAAAAKASKSSGGNYAGKGTALADLIHSLGGQGLAKAQLAPALASVVAEGNANRPLAGNRTTSGARTPYSVDAGANATDAINIAGGKLGLEPGTLQQLLGKKSPDYVAPTKPAKHTNTLSAGKVREVRQDPNYSKYAQIAIDQMNTLRTGKDKVDASIAKAQVEAQIRASDFYRKHPIIADQVIKDILHG